VSLTAADHGAHPPPDDPLWQESWLLSWYCPRTRTGGYHHVDFQPSRGRTCVQSWSAEDGEVVHRYQNLNLPGVGDPADFEAGPLRVSTREPLRGIDVVTPLGRLAFDADTAPQSPRRSEGRNVGLVDYTSAGTGHYEMFGRLTGRTPSGREVEAWAFHDHSWGPRDYGNLSATYRWGHFCFGPDLRLVIYQMTKDVKAACYGYVLRDGARADVVHVDSEVTIAGDGHTPIRAHLVAHTADGRSFELSGTTDVASVSTHDGGHFSTETFGRYTLGGRVGAGHLAVRERPGPSSQHLAWLTAHDTGDDR